MEHDMGMPAVAEQGEDDIPNENPTFLFPSHTLRLVTWQLLGVNLVNRVWSSTKRNWQKNRAK